MQHLPPLPAAITILNDEDSARLRKAHTTIPASPESGCVTCNKKGTFRWWNEDRTEVVDYECSCYDQWLLHRFFLSRGVDLNYQRLSWLDATSVDPPLLDVAADWIGRIEQNFRYGRGLLLHGEPGTGKTLMSALILKRAIALGYDAHFATFTELKNTFASGWYSIDDKRWFQRRMQNTGLLVIDDPGKEMKGGRIDLPEALLDEVLRSRVAGNRPTILATNYTLTEFAERYGRYVMSLLHESCTTQEFRGADFRVDGSSHRRIKQEMDLDLIRPVVID